MLDLRRLRVLQSVVSTGSVSEAAAELGYTPSAISQQIAALEKDTGTVLLERAGRGVRPTDAALMLAEAAGEAMARLEEAESTLAMLREGRTGRLRLASFPSAGAALVPAAVVRLRAALPDLELVLSVVEPDAALAQLRGGSVDASVVVEAFGPDDLPDDDLARVHLLDDPYRLVLPRSHPLAGRRRVALEAVAEDPWVGTASAPGHCQEAAADACRAAGFEPRYAVQADEYPTTQGFVAAGLGVALIPALGLGTLNDGVVVKRLQGAEPIRHIYAVARQARAHETVVLAAITALRDAARAVATR